jgi:hypothetical protein
MTWKPEVNFIYSNHWDSIGNTITLIRYLFPDDVTRKYMNKHPNWNTKHTLTTQDSNGIGKNITILAQLGETAREYHNKTAIRECRIPRAMNKQEGYSNIGVSVTLIGVAAIPKRLTAGPPTTLKEQTQSKGATGDSDEKL